MRARQCWFNTTPVLRRNSVRDTLVAWRVAYLISYERCFEDIMPMWSWRWNCLSLYLLILFLQWDGRTLNGKSKVLYLPITAVPGTLPSVFRAKEIFVVNEASPQKGSLRELTQSSSPPFWDSSFTPGAQCPHLVSAQVKKGLCCHAGGKSVHVFSQSYVEAFIQWIRGFQPWRVVFNLKRASQSLGGLLKYWLWGPLPGPLTP